MNLVSLHCHRTIFLNYFVNASFFKVALETFLRRECLSISFVKCKCFYACIDRLVPEKVVLSESYFSGCYQKRNIFMVNNPYSQ